MASYTEVFPQVEPTTVGTTTVVETPIINTNTETGGQDTIPGFQFWSGTGAQYDAITTKDVNTIYYVTDR